MPVQPAVPAHSLRPSPSSPSPSPLLLSFDIGTRHLAYCALALAPGAGALTEAPTVKRWAVVDLLAVEDTPYTEAATHVCLKSWSAKQLRAWLDARGLSSVGKRTELQARTDVEGEEKRWGGGRGWHSLQARRAQQRGEKDRDAGNKHGGSRRRPDALYVHRERQRNSHRSRNRVLCK